MQLMVAEAPCSEVSMPSSSDAYACWGCWGSLMMILDPTFWISFMTMPRSRCNYKRCISSKAVWPLPGFEIPQGSAMDCSTRSSRLARLSLSEALHS